MNKWEEESLTEQRKNYSNNTENGRDDITINIKKKSTNSVCKSIGKTKTTEQFVVEARERHGDRYDYSKSVYKRSNIKIEMVCSKHGSFWQEPTKHIGGQGCIGCRQTSTTEDFVAKAKLVHEDRYDYSKSVYFTSAEKVEIVCGLHGSFWQTPRGHVSGKGCPLCANNQRKDVKKFIQSAREVHGQKYDYDNVVYKNNKSPIEIVCKKHGKFYQSPKKHLQGNGCEKCGYHISIMETEFLDYLGIKTRGNRIREWKNKPVDGYDDETNTIYEFLGDYWHGNPNVYDAEKEHPVVRMTYGDLYKKTFKNLDKLVSMGYNVKYIWESDWKNYKLGRNETPNIITHS
jgi:hypothetical protein